MLSCSHQDNIKNRKHTTTDGQIITAGELFVESQYICSVRVETNWYWNQRPQYYVRTVPTHTILHPRLEVNAVTYFHAIPKSVCSRTQVNIYISINPICLNGSDYDYIL